MGRKRKQKWGWLNRYDFAYADRDTVNIGLIKLKRIAPGFIQNAKNQVDKVAKKNSIGHKPRKKGSWERSTYDDKKGHQRTG